MKDPFSFSALEMHIRQAMPDIPTLNKRKSARIGIWAGFIGAAIALAAAQWCPKPWGLWVSLAGLVVECLGFAIYLLVEARDELPRLRRGREYFAKDLDADYPPYLELLAWMRSHPMRELRERQLYLHRRQATMTRRMGLMVGSFDRLGIFPMLIAVYFQIKDIGSPTNITLLQAIFIFLLLLMFVLSHWIAHIKLRLDLYVDLFDAAASDAEGRAG